MRRIGFAVLFGLAGFILAAGATGLLISNLSSNTHDIGVEAAMTAFFAGGPLGAVVGAIVGFMAGGRRAR